MFVRQLGLGVGHMEVLHTKYAGDLECSYEAMAHATDKPVASEGTMDDDAEHGDNDDGTGDLGEDDDEEEQDEEDKDMREKLNEFKAEEEDGLEFESNF
jgi:hypothetical protein